MSAKATAALLDHAEAWLSARGIELATERGYWYFGELPDGIRILIDQNFGRGDEATFSDRAAAINALAVILGECLDDASLPK
jgi:hypothetical protein